MNEREGKGIADGTGILDSKSDKTFGSSEESTGRSDELAYSGTAGISGVNATFGNRAENVTAAAAMASGLTGDAGTADSRDDASEEYRANGGEQEDRLTVPAKRAWLHETGLHGEEAAAELGTLPRTGAAAPLTSIGAPDAREDRTGGAETGRAVRDALSAAEGAGTALGWTALLFGVVSLFIWPVLMGLTAVVLGYVAYRQGARSLGVWSMTLGVVAAAAYFLLSPIYAALT